MKLETLFAQAEPSTWEGITLVQPPNFLADELSFYTHAVLHYQKCAQQLEFEIKEVKPSPLALKRLKKFKLLYEQQANTFGLLGEKLLALSPELTPHSRPVQRMDPLPMLMRDWGYGEREIQAEAQALLPHLRELGLKNMLSLGAGACHLETLLEVPQVVALDQSFTLLWCFDLLRRQVSWDCGLEVPSPLSSDQATTHARLQAPPSSLKLLCGDFTKLALPPEYFAGVLASWFLDVLGGNTQAHLQKIANTLSPGGYFIFFGPLGFTGPHKARHLGPEELLEMMEEAGLKLQTREQVTLPYRQLPGASRRTEETVQLLIAQK